MYEDCSAVMDRGVSDWLQVVLVDVIVWDFYVFKWFEVCFDENKVGFNLFNRPLEFQYRMLMLDIFE